VVVLLGVSDDDRDFGRVVVVVLVGVDFEVAPDGLVVVVVVEDDDDFGGGVLEDDGFVVVVVVDVADGLDDGLVVEVVVDFVVDFVVEAGLVVVVVGAAGALGSSPAVDSSRAWLGPEPGVTAGGATAGGGIFSSRRAYCMIRAKTGAAT
jgi:hypothetical protein